MIRPETKADYPAIRQILIEAFADHPFSRQTEHLIVEELRRAEAMTLALVAEREGRVVGHIAFSPVWIAGKDCGWYALGPVAVTPALQRQGIGRQLVTESLAALKQRGAAGCILVGDPDYYRRFGFDNDPNITMEGVPPEVIMTLPLADAKPRGQVTHHKAFHV